MNVRFGPERLSPAVRALLIANVAVFVLQSLLQSVGMSGFFNNVFGLYPPLVFQRFYIWQIATYMFLHGSVMHLFWNMLILWMFGVEVENRMGTKKFVAFYFICGIGAGLTSLVFPPAWNSLTVGASGALYGVFVATAVFFPENMILVFFLFPMRMKHAVFLFGALQLYMVMGGGGGGIAYIAHLGGIIFALIYFQVAPRLEYNQSHKGLRQAQRDTRRAENEEREVDRILDKINREGIQSLTPKERAFLKARSERRER